MPKFKILPVRHGVVGREKTYLSIAAVTVEEGETEIVFPAYHEGEPITHIGYSEKFEEAHMRFHDWHHPAQGEDYYPAAYSFRYERLNIPDTVERILIPETVTDVGYDAFYGVDPERIEIDPKNTRLHRRKDGTIY